MAKNRARTQDDKKSVFADNNKPRQSELFETQEDEGGAGAGAAKAEGGSLFGGQPKSDGGGLLFGK